MVYFLLFIAELLCLFFLSKLLTQLISILLLHVTKNHESTIHILSFLFLPGVIIHELSHMFMASIVFVRVGTMEFLPQVHGNTVKLGSVQIAKTDPLRRFLIGAAPLLGGTALLMILFIYLSPFFSNLLSWQTILFVYALFEIGNTMFSSKKDMEGAIVLFIALGIFLGIVYLLGFRFDFHFLSALFTPSVILFFQKLDSIFLLMLIINGVFCASVKYVLKGKIQYYF